LIRHTRWPIAKIISTFPFFPARQSCTAPPDLNFVPAQSWDADMMFDALHRSLRVS